MDGAVGERLGERRVDALVLVDARQPLERGCGDLNLEVVATAPIDHAQLERVRECVFEQCLEGLGGHRGIDGSSTTSPDSLDRANFRSLPIRGR